MSGDLTAEQIRKLLELEPNATCGFVKLTFVSPQAFAAGALPAPFAQGKRRCGCVASATTSSKIGRAHV